MQQQLREKVVGSWVVAFENVQVQVQAAKFAMSVVLVVLSVAGVMLAAQCSDQYKRLVDVEFLGQKESHQEYAL